MSELFYDNLAADYDRVIRWERRLKVEKPLFQSLWDRFNVRSVLDAACGTGRHLAMFLDEGLNAVGSDESPEMIAHAAEVLGQSGHAPAGRLFTAPWTELGAVMDRRFDAVLCIGNSLPYLMDLNVFHASLHALWERRNPDGVVVVQFKNFDKLIAEKQRFLPLQATSGPVESIAVRMYDYHPDHIDFNVLMLEKIEGEWKMRHRVTPLKPYHAEDAAACFKALGAQVEVYGSLALAPYDRAKSDDVVILAYR